MVCDGYSKQAGKSIHKYICFCSSSVITHLALDKYLSYYLLSLWRINPPIPCGFPAIPAIPDWWFSHTNRDNREIHYKLHVIREKRRTNDTKFGRIREKFLQLKK